VRVAVLLSGLLLAASLALAGAPASACAAAPPCGPIPVVIEIRVDGPRYDNFGESSELVREGVVSFYINVDNDGFWFDPDKPPKMTFHVNRQPPWVRTAVTPDGYTVPISDPKYLSQEGGQPDQVQFYWEAPVTITVTKLRDPTPEEIADGSPFIRRDGSYRIVVSATTTSSVLVPDLFGPNMGLQEGYGVKELRMVPEIDGVQWLPDESGVLQPGGVAPPAKGNAAAFGLVGILLVLAVFVLRRRAA
jgi:hypothetical protein